MKVKYLESGRVVADRTKRVRKPSLLENINRENAKDMHDEAGEQEHLRPLFLVDKIFLLVRYHANTQLGNLEAANKQKVSDCSRKDVSKLLQRISSGSQLQRRGLSCRTVKLSSKSQLTKKKINILTYHCCSPCFLQLRCYQFVGPESPGSRHSPVQTCSCHG